VPIELIKYLVGEVLYSENESPNKKAGAIFIVWNPYFNSNHEAASIKPQCS